MNTPSTEVQEVEMVRCTLCTNPVWIRKDRLEKHIGKIHSLSTPSRKTFTSYHAHLESTSPPRLTALAGTPIQPGIPEAAKNNSLEKPGNVRLISRDGRRAGKGRCAECGSQESVLWHYSESNRGAVDICGSCKPVVFERSFGNTSLDLSDPLVQK